jgi:CDGSH-type Zn-finger protein/rubrerythrin
MAITTIASLRRHLQWALELEHATIPAYMCALYSIKDGHNKEASEVILSILIEEMLHMGLVANLLNAVGGSPKLDYAEFIATYPTPLPHSDESFRIPLGKFSREGMQPFLNIERPAAHAGQPEDENYESIGQFYESIEIGIQYLADTLGTDQVFTGNPGYQISSETTYYGGAGRIIAVTDLQSALAAMTEIVEQGEGLDHRSIFDGDQNMFHPEREEIGHYFRFQEILHGRYYQKPDTAESGPTGDRFDVDWSAVHNMRPNPSSSDYLEGSEIRLKMNAFNEGYSDMLRMLERCFNGEPDLLASSVGTMYELKVTAVELMQMPSGDGKTTAGPSFEYMAATKDVPADKPRIVVRPNGPYVVYGNVPLTEKTKIRSAQGEALAWLTEGTIETDKSYALCRCGQSSSKPFCDGTHARINFNGKEKAARNNIADRQKVLKEECITVKSDRSLCMHASFCNNKVTSMRRLMPDSNDIQVRTQIVSMVEHCPSGALTYNLNNLDIDIEPSLPLEISVVSEDEQCGGPLFVTGGIDITRSDGEAVEKRNRVNLCRCGASKNKPFCDGRHHKAKWNP